MTDLVTPTASRRFSPFRTLLDAPAVAVAGIGEAARDVALPALRWALAVPFFFSGLTKWDGFGRLSAGAVYLFTEEFRLHLFGAEIAYPWPKLMAAMAGSAEIVLPVLLVAGFATRWAALGLLAMTAIVQLTVPDGWANFHLPWAAMALALTVFGPGRLALDTLVRTRRN
jgi:putative oxidoreductase